MIFKKVQQEDVFLVRFSLKDVVILLSDGVRALPFLRLCLLTEGPPGRQPFLAQRLLPQGQRALQYQRKQQHEKHGIRPHLLSESRICHR